MSVIISSDVNYSWEGPRCLLENISGHEIKINEETIKLLSEIHDPMVIVSIVGLYRTGKSYLMNKLAQKQSGFHLGNTVQAQTKGIWIWCIPHPVKPNTCLGLIDTEGLGDVEKGDSHNDVILFTLAALLSSTLIYNSKGTIDQSAMDNIHFVAEIAEKLKITENSDSSEDDFQLAEHFPSFVWAVRDFSLQLSLNGESITSDEYLENALALKKGASANVTKYNLPRKCIRRYFPQRKCFVFPLPVGDPENMYCLDEISECQLLPAFKKCIKDFCFHIYENSVPKAVGGHILNGPIFAGVLSQYVDQISSGKIPSIESTVVSTAKHVNDNAIKECTKCYKTAIATLNLPCEDDQLYQHHQLCEKTVQQLFFKLAMMIGEESEVKSLFTDMIMKEYSEVCARNKELSTQKCKELLEELRYLVQTRFDSDYYFRVGGYAEYQQDIAEMVKKFHKTPGKGSQSGIILNEMLMRQVTVAKSIMAVDKNLTEVQQLAEEKQLEQEILRKQIFELEKEHERANQRAEQNLQEQTRLQKEFMTSMERKFNQELENYQRQLNQLKSLLDKEHQRLRREGADEDAEELAAYFQHLQTREQKPPYSVLRRFLLR